MGDTTIAPIPTEFRGYQRLANQSVNFLGKVLVVY